MNEIFTVIFVALQIADIWTTNEGLKLGAREVNPLLAKLFLRFEPVPTMVAVKLPSVILLWWVDLYMITAGCCALYLWVVLNNLDVIKDGRSNG